MDRVLIYMDFHRWSVAHIEKGGQVPDGSGNWLYLQNVTRAREQIFASTSAYQYNLNRRPLGHFWEICLKVVSVVIAIWYPLTCYFVYGIPVIPIHWSAKGLKHVYPSLKTCNIPV